MLLQQLARLLALRGDMPSMPSVPIAQIMEDTRPLPQPVIPVPRLRPVAKRTGMGEGLAGSFLQAGFQVLNEYENPTTWSTGGHLHVQWPQQVDRQAVASRLTRIASEEGYRINVGGWGRGAPHRGLAHKQGRALDISGIRRQ